MLNEKQDAFRKHIINLSKEIAPQYGVDWRLMAATAILETGWGQSTLAREAHNLFGITATKSNTEDEVFILRDDRWDEPKRFRFYQNEEDSCHDYGWHMSRSSLYAKAREAMNNTFAELMVPYAEARETALVRFVEVMAPIYCPEVGYGAKVLRLIRSLDAVEQGTDV